jgi:hypothetical protein
LGAAFRSRAGVAAQPGDGDRPQARSGTRPAPLLFRSHLGAVAAAGAPVHS